MLILAFAFNGAVLGWILDLLLTARREEGRRVDKLERELYGETKPACPHHADAPKTIGREEKKA